MEILACILSGEIHQAAGDTKMEILERSELMLVYTQKLKTTELKTTE